MAVMVDERTLEDGILVDSGGRIVHNASQMDDPIIRRRYDDGTVHVLSQRTGRLIVAPFKPGEVERLRCPHCGGELGGSPASEREDT